MSNIEASFNLLVPTFKDIEINELKFTNNIYLSSEDKNSFKTLINDFNDIKKTDLLSTNTVVISKINNIHNERIELKTTLEKITTVGEKVKSKIKELENFETKITEKLKNKKINAFKNFIVRFFTFGKININKNIKNEICNFKADYLEIKYILQKNAEILENIKNKFLLKIEEKHTLLTKNEEKVAELEKQLKEENEKIKEENKKIKKEIETVKQENEKTKEENEKIKDLINTKNKQFINEYTVLKNVIKGQKEEIKLLKENEKILTNVLYQNKNDKTRTDSGNESSSDTNEFKKEQVNNQKLMTSSSANCISLWNSFRK